MAEIPEIAKYTGQMKNTLCGKTVKAVKLLQEKCANVLPDEFNKRFAGAKVTDVYNKG